MIVFPRDQNQIDQNQTDQNQTDQNQNQIDQCQIDQIDLEFESHILFLLQDLLSSPGLLKAAPCSNDFVTSLDVEGQGSI